MIDQRKRRQSDYVTDSEHRLIEIEEARPGARSDPPGARRRRPQPRRDARPRRGQGGVQGAQRGRRGRGSKARSLRANRPAATIKLGQKAMTMEPFVALWQGTTHDPVAFFTAILSVSTIGLWIVTWRGIRNQARETEILERAYLNVEPGGTEIHQDRNDRVVAKIIIRNVGHLPARNVRFCGNAGATGGGADDFPIKELFPGKIVLAPGAASTQMVATIFDH
jgi:hypothetical protein